RTCDRRRGGARRNTQRNGGATDDVLDPRRPSHIRGDLLQPSRVVDSDPVKTGAGGFRVPRFLESSTIANAGRNASSSSCTSLESSRTKPTTSYASGKTGPRFRGTVGLRAQNDKSDRRSCESHGNRI